jgi:hypothetical protein
MIICISCFAILLYQLLFYRVMLSGTEENAVKQGESREQDYIFGPGWRQDYTDNALWAAAAALWAAEAALWVAAAALQAAAAAAVYWK